jgi:hypothetical protein
MAQLTSPTPAPCSARTFASWRYRLVRTVLRFDPPPHVPGGGPVRNGRPSIGMKMNRRSRRRAVGDGSV